MENKRIIFFALMVLSGIALLAFSGCGKKGPPLPPEIKGQKIAAPFDLKYKVVDNEITLSWNHKIDAETAFVKPDSFEVFMAKKTFEACEGCPFEFKPAGTVFMPFMEFATGIQKGFKYYFRVQAIGDDGMRSEHSTTVQFEYK
ncbi:fibronectin type III domain-containing protein [Desulfobacula toluolica]|uniref:Conserved uncharacterized protein n=1 Tax=Desulfobacula toluolica (strain DSM 7467 / Tol2) TaxID=651182 RepID=K0NI53_DESTT|nr:fibronectin type III domain-containing protein [Desulfobacula toluolica]CCK80615.1 conserved uncharacterized protein [Desulfobacula toluolica Tol2]